MTIMSIQRANCAFFPFSIRNSAPAIAHLIAKTGVDHLVVGREASMQNLANDALRILKDLGQKQPELSVMPTFEDYFVHITDAEIEDIKAQIPLRRHTPDETAAYFHSSGKFQSVTMSFTHSDLFIRNYGVSQAYKVELPQIQPSCSHSLVWRT
jgi:hypothetical protein